MSNLSTIKEKRKVMDEHIQHIPRNEFSDISPVSDIVQYVGLCHQVLDLSSQIVEYKKVVEEEETKRLDIRRIANKEMTKLSGELDLLEKDLLADLDRLKVFIDDVNSSISMSNVGTDISRVISNSCI